MNLDAMIPRDAGRALSLPLAAAALVLVVAIVLLLARARERQPGEGVRPVARTAVAETPPQAGAGPTRGAAVGAAFADPEPQTLPVSDDQGTAAGPAPLERDEARKESEFHALYVALAARDPAALEAEGRRLLGPAGAHLEVPDCERVALLRAAYDGGCDRALELFALAARSLPDRSGPRGESVPSFAVHFLGERAAADPRARDVLEDLAFGDDRVISGLRRRAASGLASCATGAQLARLHAHLAREQDGLLVEGVLARLARSPDPAGADPILLAFGRDPVDPTALEEQEP